MEAFDIFLSHNSADKPAVEEIGQKLKAAGLRPWLDKWELIAGTRWQGALADGLGACATCGVFIGPNGFGDWAREELDVAQNRAAKDPSADPITALAAKIKTLNSEATMKSLCDDMLADPKTLHREAVLVLELKPQIKRIVWVIDQFEEVFTLCGGEGDKTARLWDAANCK